MLRSLRHIFCLTSLLLLTVLPADAWQLKTVNGKQYVTTSDIKAFYNFDQLSRSGRTATLTNRSIQMTLNAGSQECIMNRVKFIFSYPVLEQGGQLLVSRTDLAKLIDPVLRPSYINGAGNFRTVILDPGHGGKDPGSVNQYGTEASYNLNVARIVRDLLKHQGYQVIMTRDDNTFLTLTQRVAIANRYQNAIFVSIHFNSGGRGRASGIETFTLSPAGVAHYGRGLRASDNTVREGNHQDSANIALATAIHGRTMERTKSAKIFDRGIKRARYSVLTSIKHPAILLEGGFMSHAQEARLIHTSIYQRTIAMSIAEGITRFRQAVAR